jgi:phospholipid/cholesterol/gamma-HCH transport system substrate-binding protein
VSGKFRVTLIKLAVFFVVAVVITVSVVASLLDLKLGQKQSGYSAVFTNVVGLQPGDVVRIAGVEVGKVNSISVDKKVTPYEAMVNFSVDSAQRLTTLTTATIAFENLLGQRYLDLCPGPSSVGGCTTTTAAAGGLPLSHGATIPDTRTTPGLDLTAVFSGFQPVLSALNPTQVNELTGAIIAVFQGESGAINNLLTQVSSLTSNLVQRQTLIYSVVDNLTALLTTVNTKDSQIGQLIDGLDKLVTSLAGQRGQIGGAVDSLSSLTLHLSGVLGQSQPYLDQDISKLNGATGVILQNQNGLNSVLIDLPAFLNAIDKVTSSGNYIAAYVCDLTIHTVSPANPTGNAPLSVRLSPTVPQSPPLGLPQGSVGNQTVHTPVCTGPGA